MDISSPAAFVNGGLLRMHVGRKVRTVLQVTRSDMASVMGKSTDGCQLVAKGSPPAPLTAYVEVIGVAENENTIRAELWTNFGDTFGIMNTRSFDICDCSIAKVICCRGRGSVLGLML
ncbi:hypothetical protein V6N13_087647 [Hibiscus sabdariffa]